MRISNNYGDVYSENYSCAVCGGEMGGALESVAKEDYLPAIGKLQYLARFFENKDVEYHLLKGFVEYATNNNSSAVKDLRLSINLLRKSSKYNEAEKKYLECYAAIYGNLANSSLSRECQDENFGKIAWVDVDLSGVRKELKKNFPLRKHPGWDELL